MVLEYGQQCYLDIVSLPKFRCPLGGYWGPLDGGGNDWEAGSPLAECVGDRTVSNMGTGVCQPLPTSVCGHATDEESATYVANARNHIDLEP